MFHDWTFYRGKRPAGSDTLALRLLRFAAMRLAASLLLLSCSSWAQFKSTVPLVVAPTTVTDSKGRLVDGLTTADLTLYDNGVPQAIQMDWMTYPISLVVAVETNENAGAVLDKLGGSGILFAQLLAAEAGETAVISFSDEVKVHQDFTSTADPVIHALRMLRKEGDGARMLDALNTAVGMLQNRPAGRRPIILMIAEKRDRGSKTKLPDVVERVQRMNAAVYWLTFSPFLQPFTAKPRTREDEKPIDERIKMRQCALCPAPDERGAPPDVGPGGLIYSLGELVRLHQPDLGNLFARTTGGRELSFLKKNALEQAIQLVGEEVHRQYILNFQPKNAEPGQFHTIQVVVKNRPELRVRTRQGYWAVQ